MTFIRLTFSDDTLIINHIIYFVKSFQLLYYVHIRIDYFFQHSTEFGLCLFNVLHSIHPQSLCIHMNDLMPGNCICKDTTTLHFQQFFVIIFLFYLFFTKCIIKFRQTTFRFFFFLQTYRLWNVLVYSHNRNTVYYRPISYATATYEHLSKCRMNIAIYDFWFCLWQFIWIFQK